MSLKDARGAKRSRLTLPPGPPYAAAELEDWADVCFQMPPGDERLLDLHRGGEAPTAAFENLVGAAHFWDEHEEVMELLDPDSPSHNVKMVEREIYLERWAPFIPPGCRAMDLGCGVGRMGVWMLGQGCTVELVDPDLRSLWRAVSAAVEQGKGALDAHWTTGERLPPLEPVDVVVATEVLCYSAEPERILDAVWALLKPGGYLLCSVEARWGWVFANDVPADTLEAWVGDGVVHVTGDRWVRTYEGPELAALLERRFELIELQPSHYTMSGPFELAAGTLDVAAALAWERRLREHPVAGRLNRAWMAVARKPL